MDTPIIPSDNIFKFLALTGLTLFILSITLPYKEITNLEQQIETIRNLAKIDSLENSFLNKDIEDYNLLHEKCKLKLSKYKDNDYKNFNNESLSIQEISKNLNDKNYRERIEFLAKYFETIIPAAKDARILVEQNEKIKLAQRKQKTKQMALQGKIDMLNFKIKQLSLIKWFSLIGIIFGGLLSFFGFIKWYKLHE